MQAIHMSILMGIFIPLGALIGYFIKDNDKIMKFLLSLAIGVLTPLIIFELIPESFETIKSENSNTYFLIFISFILLGMGILKILDIIVPDHDHHCHNNECKKQYLHIGYMTFITIMIHDFIESMGLYAASTVNIISGFSILFAIGMHNIPLGALISSTIHNSTKSRKITISVIFIMSLIPALGGAIILMSGNIFTELVLSYLLAITVGMLSYILIFELIPSVEIIDSIKTKKYKSLTPIVLGIIMGIILINIGEIF